MTSTDPTPADDRRPEDQDLDVEGQLDADPAPTLKGAVLTTDDEAQRDDLTIDPGSS